MGKTIQQLEVRSDQPVLDSTYKHAPITSSRYLQMHESAIREHLLNKDTCKINYSS